MILVLYADSLVDLGQNSFLTACEIFTLKVGASTRVVLWPLLQIMNVIEVARPLSIQSKAACHCRRVIEDCAVHYDLTSWPTGSGLGRLNISLLLVLFKVTIAVYCEEILVLQTQQTFIGLDGLKC